MRASAMARAASGLRDIAPILFFHIYALANLNKPLCRWPFGLAALAIDSESLNNIDIFNRAVAPV